MLIQFAVFFFSQCSSGSFCLLHTALEPSELKGQETFNKRHIQQTLDRITYFKGT